MLEFLVFCSLGKLLIFLWQQFPLSTYLSSKWKPLQKLFGCDLCLGVWIYWFLALWFEEVNPFVKLVDKYLPDIGLSIFVFIFAAFLMGAVTSFLVHIFSLGWNARFQTIVME